MVDSVFNTPNFSTKARREGGSAGELRKEGRGGRYVLMMRYSQETLTKKDCRVRVKEVHGIGESK